MDSYPGGKGGAGVVQQIINQIPPHRVYIEAFLGNGAVMRAKRPAERSIGIELDRAVIHDRWGGGQNLIGALIMQGDALEFLRAYRWEGGEFVYIDPPYLMECRSGQRAIYDHEFAAIEDHRALLRLLRGLPCMVAISGYWSALYELELAGWRSITFGTVKRSGEKAIEQLWMNYPEPIALHDYRYLGSNFRERERIKRKRLRWTSRLAKMDAIERQALLAALDELRDPIVTSGAGRVHR